MNGAGGFVSRLYPRPIAGRIPKGAVRRHSMDATRWHACDETSGTASLGGSLAHREARRNVIKDRIVAEIADAEGMRMYQIIKACHGHSPATIYAYAEQLIEDGRLYKDGFVYRVERRGAEL